MSDTSKYNFPNVQKVQIFEQVDTYIENNYPNNPETKAAISDNELPALTSLKGWFLHPTL